VRVRQNGAIVALEVLLTADGARYRDRPPGGDPVRLRFDDADGSFNAVGGFANIAKPFSSAAHYLAIYNVGVPGADAYELGNVITPPGTQIDIVVDGGGEDRVQLSPAFRFRFESPQQRVFLVEGPVTYLCDTASGVLTRYSGYAVANSQADRDSAAELVGAGAAAGNVSYNVAACAMDYTPGNAERSGLLSVSLSLSEQGETVTLLHQVHVDNTP
jgi:MSHA biogenesis protein MshO